MTCASCAVRIERKLNRLDGVDATVNFATERAAVAFDPGRVGLEELLAAVEAAGYHATPAERGRDVDAARVLARRLIPAVVLTAPLVLLAMVPPLQFAGWEWLALALATPVVLWSGVGFHHAALANARRGAATMNTLVSVGTFAAWGWSTVVLLAGTEAEAPAANRAGAPPRSGPRRGRRAGAGLRPARRLRAAARRGGPRAYERVVPDAESRPRRRRDRREQSARPRIGSHGPGAGDRADSGVRCRLAAAARLAPSDQTGTRPHGHAAVGAATGRRDPRNNPHPRPTVGLLPGCPRHPPRPALAHPPPRPAGGDRRLPSRRQPALHALCRGRAPLAAQRRPGPTRTCRGSAHRAPT
jgi:copper chaperone CopZ